jgi:hypothetical protein
MNTRQDYLNNKCTHREYYAQFVTPRIKDEVRKYFGVEQLKRALATDEHLNSIELHKWDALGGYPARRLSGAALKEAGDGSTMATTVCILKEAARQIVEEAQP